MDEPVNSIDLLGNSAPGGGAVVSDDVIIEVEPAPKPAAAAAALAAPAVPKGATTNPATVQSWNDPDVVDATGATVPGLGALPQYLVGFRTAAGLPERTNARAHQAAHGRVVCLRCSNDVITERPDALTHLHP